MIWFDSLCTYLKWFLYAAASRKCPPHVLHFWPTTLLESAVAVKVEVEVGMADGVAVTLVLPAPDNFASSEIIYEGALLVIKMSKKNIFWRQIVGKTCINTILRQWIIQYNCKQYRSEKSPYQRYLKW